MMLLIFIKNFTFKFSAYNSAWLECDSKCHGFKSHYSPFGGYFYINNIKFSYDLKFKSNDKE